MTKKRIRPPPTAAQLRRTAIREAGHAVVGRVLKQVCEKATIVANMDEGEAGYSITADPYVTRGTGTSLDAGAMTR
jgi:ATP-dependent Zn protease